MKQLGVSIVVAGALTSCGSSHISESIGEQFAATRTVDLQVAAPESWDRVCIIGPYQGNEAAQQTLGFSWPVESRSSITKSDGISLLLFVRAEDVVAAVEQRRDRGDFSSLDGRCFSRSEAQFVHSPRAEEDWPELVPSGGA